MVFNFSDFEPRVILKLFLCTKVVTSPKNLRENIPIFSDVLTTL